jgi:arginine exporter protein ArgO
LGQFNIGAYSLGKATQEPVLYVMWVGTIFFLMIHLLNFLIAIMGQTFSDNNDVKEMDTTRSHLRFCLSNWWMNPIPHKDTTQYLITAFLKEGDDDEEQSEIQNLQT